MKKFINILVTGGCGFIASNFLNYMVHKYPNINFINLDVMYYCASHDNITVSNSPNYQFIRGNICSHDLITYILEKYEIDVIIHFAAQSHVDNSFSTPLQYTEDNIKGTHTLLECSRLYNKLKLFIHVSTDEVYGESELNENPKKETSVLCPTNPYAATKAAAEMLVRSYHHSYQLPTIITRGNNVYGPNQYPEKLIPKFIKSLQNNEKCSVHGTGEAIRSFLYVDDVYRAFEIILQHGKVGEIYNIGTNKEYNVLEITRKLVKLIKNDDEIDKYVEFIEDRNFNDKRYFISSEKLEKLGWKPRVNIDDGLKKIL